MESEEIQNYKEVMVLGVLHTGIIYYLFTFSKNRKNYCGGMVQHSMYESKSKVFILHAVTSEKLLETLFNAKRVPIEHIVKP